MQNTYLYKELVLNPYFGCKNENSFRKLSQPGKFISHLQLMLSFFWTHVILKQRKITVDFFIVIWPCAYNLEDFLAEIFVWNKQKISWSDSSAHLLFNFSSYFFYFLGVDSLSSEFLSNGC